jgi:hypothetical protein
MTVRYDPHIEWEREDRQNAAIAAAREAVDRLRGVDTVEPTTATAGLNHHLGGHAEDGRWCGLS